MQDSIHKVVAVECAKNSNNGKKFPQSNLKKYFDAYLMQEKLNKSIAECTTMLEGVQQRWHEYEQYYGSLVRWLADTENTLRNDPEPRALLVERKAQLDKYKVNYKSPFWFLAGML